MAPWPPNCGRTRTPALQLHRVAQRRVPARHDPAVQAPALVLVLEQVAASRPQARRERRDGA